MNSFFEEALETREQTGSFVTLRCGCTVELDPDLSDFARTSLIRAHYLKHHKSMTAGRKF